MRLTCVGDDTWVGSSEACDARGASFDRVVHLWKESDIAEGVACRCSGPDKSLPTPGFSLLYKENDPLATLPIDLAVLVPWLAEPARLLIHCRGGVCRSATLAVLAKVARGRRPHAAVREVMTGIWDGYGCTAKLGDRPIGEIFRLAGLPAPWDAPPTMRAWP